MILITVGSQKFQFNRLLKKIDELIDKKVIKDKVFAQIGASDYVPKNYEYIDFVTQEEFNNLLEKSTIVITHAGTGVIVNATKKGKKVIAIPRLKKYGEHVDDHQIQLIKQFEELNIIEPCYDLDDLEMKLNKIKNKKYNKYKSNKEEILKSIIDFIEK